MELAATLDTEAIARATNALKARDAVTNGGTPDRIGPVIQKLAAFLDPDRNTDMKGVLGLFEESRDTIIVAEAQDGTRWTWIGRRFCRIAGNGEPENVSLREVIGIFCELSCHAEEGKRSTPEDFIPFLTASVNRMAKQILAHL